MSTFDSIVAQQVLRLKQLHAKRGATRILHDLAKDPETTVPTSPKQLSVAEFSHPRCPELLHSYHHQPTPLLSTCRVHELWQVDSKEGMRFQDTTIALALAHIARDPSWFVYRIYRVWITEWDSDGQRKSLRSSGVRNLATPVHLVVGGLKYSASFWTLHSTDGSTSGRTWTPRSLIGWHTACSHTNPVALQADLDTARVQHNAVLGSQAGDCRARIPLQGHPEVSHIQRPYHPAAEFSLFSLAHVAQFLSQFTWQYKVSAVGQIPIHDYPCGVGATQAGKTLDMRLDPRTRALVSLMHRPPKK